MGRLLVLFTFLSLAACASRPADKASCDQRDWFELGRHDGAQGATEDILNRHSKDCRKQFRSDWETMYANGRNAGLVEYCSPDNGFQLGKMGIAYMYVCPSTMESKFLSSYRKGQRARELEIENKKLDSKIDTISEKLSASRNEFEKARMGHEIIQLQAQKSQIENELNKTFSKSQ